MPYEPTTPLNETVMAPQSRDLDTFHIHSFMVQVDPNDASGVVVNVSWSKGFMDSGTYYPCFYFTNDFSGQAAVDAVGAEVTEGSSRYDEIKIALWTLLIDAEQVPEGEIT